MRLAMNPSAAQTLRWKPQEVAMDVPVTEEQIRTLAFYLWENDGGPEGRAEEYWEKARQQLVPNASSAEPKPAG